ncbi:MAG TPA: T9SS type A sorting domain-containing protein [Cytophagales bacterium]|nr:T9SS type A sorting domain-containing protein [Cytophagales bacterium]
MKFKKLFTSKNKNEKLSTFLIISATLLFLSINFSILAQAPNVNYKGPITIRTGGVYSGNWESKNSKVPAVTIATDQPVTIQNSTIKSAGDIIYSASRNANVTVRNTRGYATTPTINNKTRGRFLLLHKFKKAIVENNYMESTAGIYLAEFTGSKSASETIRIRYNKAKNIDGRYKNGGRAYVQFCVLNNVKQVKHIDISWNEIINLPNQSAVEDNINIHKSSGTRDSYLLVHDNYIQGAYPTNLSSSVYSGGGINVADGSGSTASSVSSYVKAYNNHIVGTSNHGMVITAGNNNVIENNRIISCGYVVVGSQTIQLRSQNVGIAIYNMHKNSSRVYFNNGAKNNTIGWVNTSTNTDRNDFWIKGGFNLNNKSLSGKITRQTELNEYKLWLEKVRSNRKKIGLLSGSVPQPSPVTEEPTPEPEPEPTPGSSTAKRFEAETYTELSDVGSTAIKKVKVKNHSAGASVLIANEGDKIRISFSATSGKYTVKARVRSGYYTSSSSDNNAKWPNGYGFWINGVSSKFTGSNSTISGKDPSYGGSYWGTMQSTTITLKSGKNTVDISAKHSWAAVDYIEIIPSGSNSNESEFSSEPIAITTPPSGETQRIEAEKYKELSDPGKHSIGTLKVANHSNNASVKLYDQGDKIRLSFTGESGKYIIKARVRSGYYNSGVSDKHAKWPGGYSFWINGASAKFTGDNSTISGKDASFGGSYWGTMNSTVVTLRSGTNTVDISASHTWAGIDYIEIVPANSNKRLVADEEASEIEHKKFNVYPNPAADFLTIEGENLGKGAVVSLWSSAGDPILKDQQIESFDKKATLDLKRYNLQPGLYLLRIRSGSELYERKIYKN